jgi:hypothetical protein
LFGYLLQSRIGVRIQTKGERFVLGPALEPRRFPTLALELRRCCRRLAWLMGWHMLSNALL